MRLQSFYYYRFFIIDRLGTSQSLMVYRKCENITYFRLLKAKLYAMSDNTKIHWISLKDLRTVTKKIVAYKRPFMTSSSSWGRYLSPIRIQTLLNIFAAAKDSDSSRRFSLWNQVQLTSWKRYLNGSFTNEYTYFLLDEYDSATFNQQPSRDVFFSYLIRPLSEVALNISH